jgi:hypothetical protein
LPRQPARAVEARGWIAAREEVVGALAMPPSDAAGATRAAPASASSFRVRVYDVRLVQSRRVLTFAAPAVHDSIMSARVMYPLIGAADREHFAVRVR